MTHPEHRVGLFYCNPSTTAAVAGFRWLVLFPAIFMVLLMSTPAVSQDSAADSVLVEDIVVQGNKKTHTEVILREMVTRPGMAVDLQTLELDRLRIESLGLFNRVQMDLQPMKKGYRLVITVTEQWYLFPFPILFFNDREISLKKLSYGLGVVHTNFRGRAELLQFAGWLGYNPTAELVYTNPWISGDRRLFARLQLLLANTTNKTFDILNQRVTEKQVGIGVTLGKRLTLRTSLALTLFYLQLRLSPAVPGQTLDPGGRDRSLQVRISYIRDFRDLVWYPTRGYYLELQYAKTGPPGGQFIDYGQLGMDARGYLPLGSMTVLGLWASIDWSHGRVPIYDRLFFGYRYRIRGHFSRRLEGEHRMLLSAGLRFPVIPVRYVNLNSEMLGPYGQNLRYGLSAEIFVDAGTLWFQKRNDRVGAPPSGGPFGLQTRPQTWLPGAGVGLNVHLPYVNIMRLEWAINDRREQEVIVDIGVAF